jgi:predicted RNA-binding protein with PUA-like domain
MNLGDLCLFYHSNEGLAVVGIARVSKTFYPDPTATSGDWSAVDMAPVKAFTQPVTLAEIKKNPVLSEVGLVKNARLSVMPLRSDEFFTILDMGLTEL